MKILLQKMRNIGEWTLEILAAMMFLVCIFGFLKVVIAPLAPLTTIVFVRFFTILACEKRTNMVMAIGGIILYAASWPVTAEFGVLTGMPLWCIGISMWFRAAYLASMDKIRLIQRFNS